MKLLAGKTAEYAIGQLREIKQALGVPRTANAYPGSTRYADDLTEKILLYLNWVSTAERKIRDTFADAELVDGLYSERYWRIGQLTDRSAFAAGIVCDEIWYQEQRITQAIETLTEWRKLGQRSGELLVIDLNILLSGRPYDRIRWMALAGSAHVRLILTMPVIEALEDTACGGDIHLKERASGVLSRIDAAFSAVDTEFVHIDTDDDEIGEVTLELLHDFPGYSYQVARDVHDAVLDRAEFLRQATGRPVCVATGSIRMKLHCRTKPETVKQVRLPQQYQLTRIASPALAGEHERQVRQHFTNGLQRELQPRGLSGPHR